MKKIVKKRVLKEDVAPEPTTADQKILWGRAAGRCAWKACRVKLTLDRVKEPAVTLGEICHIVGETSGAARGKEGLPMSDRGKYSNLILMCRHHHSIIDRDPAKHTVGILHELKDKHERWVEDKLAQTPDPDDLVYADVIDTVTKTLPLDRWRTFTDHAIRDMIHPDLVDARGTLNTMLLKTLWPKKFPALQKAIREMAAAKAIREMAAAFDEYITVYAANADQPLHSHMLRPLRGYRHGPPHHVRQGQEEENEWSNACYALLAKFVVKLNAFAETVRKNINPMYRRREGKFLMFDDLGVRHGMQPAIVEPHSIGVEEMVVKYVPMVKKRLLS
jgi:hypothetical protein